LAGNTMPTYAFSFEIGELGSSNSTRWYKGLALWGIGAAQEPRTLPIGKDTKLVIIESHIPMNLFQSVQRFVG
jgi:hypothetical protein